MAAPAVTNPLSPVTLFGALVDGTITPVLVDANGAIVINTAGGGVPNGATMFTASSGNVANASAAATITATASVLGYCSGFTITGGGATAGVLVNATLAGLLGGTMTFTFGAPTGATVAGTPIIVNFDPPIPASAVNTAIVVTLPALGAGNTHASVTIEGFKI